MPRRYEQRVRAEEAERTRMRIIEAVFDHLRETPAEPVALDAIARRAGVARSTVYAIFGSRAGLFDAVGRELGDRSGIARLLDVKHQPDARDQLRAGLHAAAAMLAANRDVYRALWSLGRLDPQAVGGVVERMEADRGSAMARIAGLMAEQGLLRDGVTRKDAEHTLWVLTSPESMDSLYAGRGLSAKRTADLLYATAERALT
jgi:AcrR family transcriptional regulator